uniref:Uncharacterized protein n=1 Tax=viral metagenome TaxID=1070528 RepID=A0A6C0DIK6_9ZZZZ
METTTKTTKATKSTKSRTTKAVKNTAESAPVTANNIELITSEKVEPETTAQPEPQQAQPQPTTQQQEEPTEKKEIRLIDVPVTNENVALNLMVGFLNTAHKRGAFTIDESAKIWECIQKFQR